MQIIVVGCGNVGATLTQQLSKEGHNVVVIDPNNERLRQVTESYDVMAVQGNGASYEVQMEAGIEQSDLLIAATNSDEVNLLCCLIAKKAGNCHTIARVRNPVYNREIDFIKEELGLSLVTNPELATARAVSRLLKFPSAIEVETFARGRVELSRFRLEEENILVGCTLREISGKLHSNVLICIVERGDQVVIPDGNFKLEAKDIVSVVAPPRNILQLFKTLGLATNPVKNAMIIGGGSTPYYLANLLLANDIHVKIIERDERRCEELCELLPQASIICGDGTDRDVLMEEGIGQTQAFVAMTNLDEENIMLSMYAKTVSQAKIVTKIHRVTYDNLLSTMDLGSIIYPQFTTAEAIVRYVRAMSKTLGSNVETLYQLVGNRVEALEFLISENSPVVDIPLMEMNLKDNLLVAGICRKNAVIIPGGHDTIQVGDSVIVITTHVGLNDIRDILR